MRLSQKAWNNVLIFGVLTIIFLFNFSHKLTLTPKATQATIIDNDVIIVEIKTPDFAIKRTGREWISEPNLGLNKQQLSDLVKHWQYTALPIQNPISQTDDAYIMQVYGANNSQPIVVKLSQQGEHYQLQINKEKALFLSNENLPLFLGR